MGTRGRSANLNTSSPRIQRLIFFKRPSGLLHHKRCPPPSPSPLASLHTPVAGRSLLFSPPSNSLHQALGYYPIPPSLHIVDILPFPLRSCAFLTSILFINPVCYRGRTLIVLACSFLLLKVLHLHAHVWHITHSPRICFGRFVGRFATSRLHSSAHDSHTNTVSGCPRGSSALHFVLYDPNPPTHTWGPGPKC